MQGEVVYRVDVDGIIRFVNREYDEFAFANEGGAVSSASVVGRPLWDFLGDATTRHVYRAAIERVRDGHPVEFPFRCDSPSRRRLLRMTIRAVGAEIEFRVRTIAIQDRPPVRLWAAEAPRSEAITTACGWCKKIRVGDVWSEVEDAIVALGLFEARAMPTLTHGICGPCRDQMLSLVHDEP